MAGEELPIIRLRRDFNRDGFHKVLFVLGVFVISIILLIATSVDLLLSKPEPIKFSTDNEWRIVKPVPIEQPYLIQPDLIQWVSGVLPRLFNYDFMNYANELQKNEHYFTEKGWKKFLALLNNYAPYTTVLNSKLFIKGSVEGAPFLLNQGVLAGRYSWWVQMPVSINYSGGYSQMLDLQALVVRVSTLDNLYGVAIENILTANRKVDEDKVMSHE
ncbi:MAG: hypothetical protein K0S27_798 [Gammaproteobacteria bacterium]|jgi:intracellular multiplication protein IcmL|nr:hypothetical protein [Gammaproteobacteria bacterium]